MTPETPLPLFDINDGVPSPTVHYTKPVDVLNHTREQQARNEGITRAERRAEQQQADLLNLARSIAVEHAKAHGEVTADDVQKVLIERGYLPGELGNAAGSIFRGKQWVFVRFTTSAREGRHASTIRVWRLR